MPFIPCKTALSGNISLTHWVVWRIHPQPWGIMKWHTIVCVWNGLVGVIHKGLVPFFRLCVHECSPELRSRYGLVIILQPPCVRACARVMQIMLLVLISLITLGWVQSKKSWKCALKLRWGCSCLLDFMLIQLMLDSSWDLHVGVLVHLKCGSCGYWVSSEGSLLLCS